MVGSISSSFHILHNNIRAFLYKFLINISLAFIVMQGVCGCDRFSSGSIRDVIKTVVKKDGYSGLMRGWIPRMLFHAPAAAICWSTYEAAKAFFEELNGRSN